MDFPILKVQAMRQLCNLCSEGAQQSNQFQIAVSIRRNHNASCKQQLMNPIIKIIRPRIIIQTPLSLNYLRLSFRSFVFLLLESRDFLLHTSIISCLQLRAVAEEEENLHPDEEGGKEQSLNQVIEQSRSTTLKGTVADKLQQPGDDMDPTKPVVGCHSICS